MSDSDSDSDDKTENAAFIGEDSEDHDYNMTDRDPSKFEIIRMSVPDTTDTEHIPKFDHDDGHWILEMTRRKRDVAKGIVKVITTGLYHLLLLILTCGATEADLTYGAERYPLYTFRYSKKGPGKYKHFMKINSDDWYQIAATDEDRPPYNYTFDPGVKYQPGGAVSVDRQGRLSAGKVKVAPGGDEVDVSRPKDHDLADPHFVGGFKGNGIKHGRSRPLQNLKFFEEVRIVIYQTELEHRRKSSMWVSNDIIVQNKADHKSEKVRISEAKKVSDREIMEASMNTSSEQSARMIEESLDFEGGKAMKSMPSEVRHLYLTDEAIENTNLNKTQYKPDKPLYDRLAGFNKRQLALNREMSEHIEKIDPKNNNSVGRKRRISKSLKSMNESNAKAASSVGDMVANHRGSVTMMRDTGKNDHHHTVEAKK